MLMMFMLMLTIYNILKLILIRNRKVRLQDAEQARSDQL